MDVPDLDLVLPFNGACLEGEARDVAEQASAAWEAAVCWRDEYSLRRLAEVRPDLPMGISLARWRTVAQLRASKISQTSRTKKSSSQGSPSKRVTRPAALKAVVPRAGENTGGSAKRFQISM